MTKRISKLIAECRAWKWAYDHCPTPTPVDRLIRLKSSGEKLKRRLDREIRAARGRRNDHADPS